MQGQEGARVRGHKGGREKGEGVEHKGKRVQG